MGTMYRPDSYFVFFFATVTPKSHLLIFFGSPLSGSLPAIRLLLSNLVCCILRSATPTLGANSAGRDFSTRVYPLWTSQ